ncbi:MAG: hypothetical protein A3F04_00020 [Candidatus Chisholmbacteria bacterium RIFCSPHIGHO2_12_FULL_49_9]|uniref:Glycosyl transferase family 1 domain-containing protein n=1 Tax=Candidatus Chisholmbacteria bacterium RIFCSPHIGHO2_01_FULL_52_32 TaxID=1797591 RepID=A0A1G1VSZ0_9BACT|nr:MAG: hypothetical protein A2786_03420 [Candidatus Chisholmbacteria bacterium RIFCSPHIGHO2_01_FULL_52_32]OGY20108.1 MAG: hypothetical protein A2900_03325 [Candidatus Chisholmbacteria bacterium RIFCSPLOWO2_01_FULL_50_28]OGY20678.1 MAG: hypothetical protein A3F04_00020 [Candidatus Chisholmbacteria bacterium RIFCSPHIGHO2_12_FULL_49_9]
MKKQKICFVIPRFDLRESSHYPHIYEGIEEIGKRYEVFLFAETWAGSGDISSNVGCYRQRMHVLPLRLLERFLVFLTLRLAGYKTFYCHYAVVSSLIAKCVTTLFGGKTYLWLCVKLHLYEQPLNIKNLQVKLTKDWPWRIALKAIDRLVTCSEAMKIYFEKSCGVDRRKILVIPNWINLSRFKKENVSTDELRKRFNLNGKKVVLFLHHLSERKGADRLPDFARLLKTKLGNAQLLIVGGGPLLESLKVEFRKGTLGDTGTVVGPVPNQKIPQYLAVADVLIMPSRTEEFGRVFLEAMAMEVPIVATDTIGARAVLTKKQQRLLIPQHKENAVVEKLGSAVATILKNPVLREELIKEGKTRVKEFEMRKVVSRFAQLVIS